MPLALGTEEIREVFKFYSELESLTGDSHPEWEPAFETEGGKHQTAHKRLLWRRYIESASNRLNQGNPLKIKS